MDRTRLLNFLCQCNSEEIRSFDTLEQCFEDICNQLGCRCQDVTNTLSSSIGTYFSPEMPADWKCVCLSFYILHLLNLQLEESPGEILSVQQTKVIKTCMKNIVTVGIYTRLQPNLPFYAPSDFETEDIFLHYNILKCTTLMLCEFMKKPNMRLLILPDSLKPILLAVYQIAYCPLKKPDGKGSMTPQIYQKLLEEKTTFLNLLNSLRNSIHPGLYIRDTMIIFQSNSPNWFKKAISHTLTSIIRSKNGIENISVALLDGISNDTTQTWKILDTITKLILSCRNLPDFQENTCKQVVDLLDKVNEDTLIFERIFVYCMKNLHRSEPDFAEDIFVRPVVSYLLFFTYQNRKFNKGEDITEKLRQVVRLSHAIFVEDSVEQPRLPLKIITPVILVLFRLYVLTLNTSFKAMNGELKSITISFLEAFPEKLFTILDSLLFNIDSMEVLPFRNNVVLSVKDDRIVADVPDYSVGYSITDDSECLLQLFESKTDLLVKFFGFLLNCLTNRDKYFNKANEDLLNVEEEVMNGFIERNLIVYKLLSDLADDKDLQKAIIENPSDIISYIDTVLTKTIELSTHKSGDTDHSAFQSMFTVLMILQSLVVNSSKTELKQYGTLLEPLQVIASETTNQETKNMIEDILLAMGNNERKPALKEEKSELDKALDDVCDPLLPTRGHGLMTLSKLVEKKDKNVMERKQYVLNIFQQNLKNDDSYVYLSAIGGLAAFANVFPDTVLNILCEEYSDSTKKYNDDGHEVRMKLGESLVRVTKILGDMAPKYKSLLLNTFLSGARDEDDLIRASSLSNLGEICRVLGYKLGTIVTEVLACVHAIISSDHSPQARRAAVTVLRQLFVGLEKEMVVFLKDEILPVYRTLKDIYRNDQDEVVRLQAQLALEELSENVKGFVFPSPRLHSEKNIIMLD